MAKFLANQIFPEKWSLKEHNVKVTNESEGKHFYWFKLN